MSCVNKIIEQLQEKNLNVNSTPLSDPVVWRFTENYVSSPWHTLLQDCMFPRRDVRFFRTVCFLAMTYASLELYENCKSPCLDIPFFRILCLLAMTYTSLELYVFLPWHMLLQKCKSPRYDVRFFRTVHLLAITYASSNSVCPVLDCVF